MTTGAEWRATDERTGGQKGRKPAQPSLFPRAAITLFSWLRRSPIDALQQWWVSGETRHLWEAAERACQRLGVYAEECLAKVYGYGAKKYEPRNWERGYPWSWAYDAALRHAWAAEAGEWYDSESYLPHWAHFVWHCITLLTFMETYPEGDDRPWRQQRTTQGGGQHDEHSASSTL
jgi:hypothetical protein